MNADAIKERSARRLRERAQAGVQQQRKSHRVRRIAEDEEKRIAGGADFLAVAERAQNFPHERVMPLNQRQPFTIAQVLLELRRTHQVREHERDKLAVVGVFRWHE
ncbi:MAG: hypothetical protein HY043_22580 [Verrucomicrobia bacterium]|nr:hypothetical protein [Verrucomicrobiota bacterium]